MQLKYTSKTFIDDEWKVSFETPFIPFFQKTKDEFLIFDFSDQNSNLHHLEISEEEVKIKYLQNELYMILDEITHWTLKHENQEYTLDLFLYEVSLGLSEVNFKYEMQNQGQVLQRVWINLTLQK
ncbi:hypothetical protein JN00_0432 [Metamycoplasma subdolum]|uniref:Uncharacterized protein n=1 Tax=Metamycoplasma subdolum TaxID=92407 RepID=A0A3L9ZXH3_9BACT|nr:hypothetical protein [Metamycoplasma subdolum]RMA77581.1 hypothetical protein JN00_0432 [Metamycoplasma subdolum]WPB50375.1 hypothetical protein R9C05_02105 [Metamycoplasma subdolum]